MPEREYVITEHFIASQDIYVRANSKAEALENAADGITFMGDIYPKRAMSVHDVRVSDRFVICEECGRRSSLDYSVGQVRERGRCGMHTHSDESVSGGKA